MFFWNDEKIEVVYADNKPFVACSNFFEAKQERLGWSWPSGSGGKAKWREDWGDSKGKIEEESADTEVRVEAVCQRLSRPLLLEGPESASKYFVSHEE